MEMYFDVTRIDHEPFVIGLHHQLFQQFLPCPGVSPTTKTTMRIFPIPIIARQVAPGRAGAQNPKHRVNKASVVMSATSPSSFPSWQMGFK
jgi:hypothetical protein